MSASASSTAGTRPSLGHAHRRDAKLGGAVHHGVAAHLDQTVALKPVKVAVHARLRCAQDRRQLADRDVPVAEGVGPDVGRREGVELRLEPRRHPRARQLIDAVAEEVRRSDELERRRELMQAWARWCEPKAGNNVVQLKK